MNAISIGGGLLFLIALIVVVNKLSTGSIEKLNANKYVIVVERTPVNKDTTLFVVKIGEEGVVLLQSQSNATVLKNLCKEEMVALEGEKVKNKGGLRLDKPIYDLKSINLKKVNKVVNIDLSYDGVISKLVNRKRV